jgi:hypothetical protein
MTEGAMLMQLVLALALTLTALTFRFPGGERPYGRRRQRRRHLRWNGHHWQRV